MVKPDPLDIVVKEPFIDGPLATAWLLDHDKILEKAGLSDRKDEDALVASWIVCAPWAHPLWHSYTIHLVHLRPLPNKETRFYLEGATHELWVHALDPAKHICDVIDGYDSPFPMMLQPKNYADQFIAENDAAALERMERVVRLICDGNLSPDTDFISQWVALFGGHMLKNR